MNIDEMSDQEKSVTCAWSFDEWDYYNETSCGHQFCLEGGLEDNVDFAHCPYCGLAIEFGLVEEACDGAR